jgi:hypothetical protein
MRLIADNNSNGESNVSYCQYELALPTRSGRSSNLSPTQETYPVIRPKDHVEILKVVIGPFRKYR